MNDSEKPLVYVILGATGSGRREVLADLIKDGVEEDELAVVLLAKSEPDDPLEVELGRVVRWTRLEDGSIEVPDDALAGVSHVFFVTDGRENPVDQLEAFKPWFDQSGCEIARVICLVHCQLAEKHPELMAWYEACIHFSDVVLLGHRDGVANKWMSEFQARFKDLFYPCLFEFIKQGHIKNPPLILEPQARRMSHLFDEADWLVDGVDAEDDVKMGEGDDEGEEGTESEVEVEVTQAIDPYFERHVSGRRVKEIPDIGKFLP